jgi:hypothetical protein
MADEMKLKGEGYPGVLEKCLALINDTFLQMYVLFIAIPPDAILIFQARIGRNRQLLKTNIIKY